MLLNPKANRNYGEGKSQGHIFQANILAHTMEDSPGEERLGRLEEK